MKEDPKRTSPLAWIFLASVVLLFFLMAIPLVLRERTAAEHTKSVSHARHIGLTLLEFEQSFGEFPDASTAEKVRENSDKPLNFSFASSNDYLFQLLAAK